MGQRLVMSIYENKCDDEPILNIYYHWSAYSRAAYYEANRFINAFCDIEKSDSLALDVIQALENCGARVLEKDRKNIIKELNYEPLTDNLDRSEGLIAYSKDQRKDILKYAEGEIDVILSSEEVYNYCFWVGDEDCEDGNEVPQVDNLEYATFDTLEQVIATLENMVDNNVFSYRNECGDIIHLIE